MTSADSGFAARPRQAILDLEPSRIRQIANGAMGRGDVAAFWFGESDLPTPAFIRDAAMASLAAGETYYTQNMGDPALRQAIAGYVMRLRGITVTADRIAVTGSGVSALMLTAQMLLSPGDRAVMVTPIWPNIAEIPRILGAEVVRVPLQVANGRWQLDVDRLLAELTPETRVLYLNSPNNPTGWIIEPDTLATVAAHCRRHGIWLVSDDVYERLAYAPGMRAAPSALGAFGPDERLILVNSFSKAWCMTGWRIGWLVVPAGLADSLSTVIEYNTSCVPRFVQRGALAALEGAEGEAFVATLVQRLAASRDRLLAGLGASPGIEVPRAEGAMYAFLRIAGEADDMVLAQRLLDQVGLGLAPGSAFGPEGQGWLRWCFAAGLDKLDDGLERLQRFLAAR